MKTVTARIYKDRWTPSRPWNVDLIWPDGSVWKGYQNGFRTKKVCIQNCEAAANCAGVNLVWDRGEDR